MAWPLGLRRAASTSGTRMEAPPSLMGLVGKPKLICFYRPIGLIYYWDAGNEIAYNRWAEK